MSHSRSARTACVILAAGSSSRMGKHKFALPFDGERLFIHKIAGEYLSAGCHTAVVVVSPAGERYSSLTGCFNDLPIHVVVNKNPGRGRMLSIVTGLRRAGSCDFAFIQNVDQPFISDRLLTRMMKAACRDAYVAPVFEGRTGHPVLLGRDIMEVLLGGTEDDLSFRDFLARYTMIPVAGGGAEIFININTPEDYRRYFS